MPLILEVITNFPGSSCFCSGLPSSLLFRLGDITFVLKTGPQPAERTRPDRKGIGFARPSPGPIRPHDRTVRPGRQWTTIDRDHHITADQTVRPGKHDRVDPISANKKPTYAVLTILSPINLNRLVKT
ncbi:unnamed protein product [Microthlaspi erraticum]|uniref:Uncharacterized protein n=1 Tax=Microthlaspi erraticum TaxID=1685480 RepID=A0A6D2K2N5_9BRAS|nr:unnamed protein product [Microthlaspi erraticum]